MSFGSKILKYQDDILKDMEELIAIPSVRGEAEEGMPFGKESAKALNCILAMAEKMGFATKNIGNYAGHAEYGEGEEVAAVVTHVDIVPEGEGWDTDPFTLTRKGNLYFARGSADDKGAAVAALYCLKVLKDENIKPKRRMRAIFGAGEETGSNDLEMYLESEQMPIMAFTPDSDYGICNREKGLLRLRIAAKQNDSSVIRKLTAGIVVNAVPSKATAFIACEESQCAAVEQAAEKAQGHFSFIRTGEGLEITSTGTASHAMQPQEGFNAATHLLKLLEKVFSPKQLGTMISFINTFIGTELHGESLGIQTSDEESGPLTLNLGLVHIDSDEVSIGIDIRYPVTADGDSVLAEITKKAEASGLAVTIISYEKPLFLPENSPFISLLKNAYEEVTGEAPTVYATGGGTYARAFKGHAVAFGPLFPEEPDRRLHNTNENIDIEYFMLHAQICLEAMYRMFTE